jgi:hypothetical protein
MSWIDTIDDDFGHWFAGFTDGEGCFYIGYTRYSDQKYFYPKFSISQRADDIKLLEFIRDSLAMGIVYVHDRIGQINPVAQYVVTNQSGWERLIALFEKYPLRSKKIHDFEIWKMSVREKRLHGGMANKRLAELCETLHNVRKYNTAELDIIEESPIAEQLSFSYRFE